MMTSDNLHEATKRGDADAVRAFLERGDDSNAADQYGETPLALATMFGHVDVAASLLDAGADTDRPSLGIDRFTPIGYASVGGNTEVVALLLSRGVRVEAHCGGFGMTPLLAATQPPPEYVLQIDTEPKALWAWGDGGVEYIGRGTGTARDVWTLEWQRY